MKWFLIGGGALVGLVAVMAIVGALLPQAHVATRSARFDLPPASLFLQVEQLTAESAKDVPFDVAEREPPTKLVTRIKPGQPFGGTWTYELTPDGQGTRLTITERGEVYNPLFRFLSRYAFGQTASLDAYLKKLAAR